MNKTELIKKIYNNLRYSEYKKSVIVPSKLLTVTDEEGTSKSFRVRGGAKQVNLNTEDVEAVITAFMYTVAECMKKGEDVNLSGFGRFHLKHKKQKTIFSLLADPEGGGKYVDIPEKYIASFTCGKALNDSAFLYTASLKDLLPEMDAFDFDEDKYAEEVERFGGLDGDTN